MDIAGVAGELREEGLDKCHPGQLFDKLVQAFDAAADLNDRVVAAILLALAEPIVTSSAGATQFERQSYVTRLVAAHERLWNLRRS